jgi:hypothetical protein
MKTYVTLQVPLTEADIGYKIYDNNIFIEIPSVLYMVNCYNEVMYNGCAVNVTV